uniref:FYVE and coiled-coil domain-containing protein 1 n=1 Tax=Scophthalmus maximus TaxID=52904 RepID=A0A8D3B332_SCOMX
MASCSSVGDNQLQRIIRDLHDAVSQLSKEHRECGEPITDDSANLHKFFYKLEYLLQFDQKEKTTFLGQRKDYWDYFCNCLIKIKGANDGIRFVKSIPELKTSLGKGRAFIRYSLVHQRLADTLQQCLINQKVTSDWYYARSPFLKCHLTADIINHLYELNQIQFDVAARGYDLDADWPAFARRTLGTASPFLWKPPSRCSSINSLVSSYSQSQVHDFLPAPDLSHSLLGELGELGEPSPCSIAENLRFELDQSELRQQALLVQVQELSREAAELKDVVEDLQGELGAQKLTASYCDSAWKIQELQDKLKRTEEERLEAKREAEDRARHCERLAQELKLREEELRSREEKLAEVKAGAHDEQEEALRRLEELQGVVGRIQGALSLKEKETGNLRAQLQDLQASLECRERHAEDLRKRLQEEREEEEQRCSSQNEELENLILDLRKTIKNREKEFAVSSERINHLEEQVEKLNVEKESLSSRLTDNEVSFDQTEDIDDYKTKCSNIMEMNTKLLQTVKQSEDNVKELTESRTALLDQLASLRASERHLKGRLEKLLDENLHFEVTVQKALVHKEASDTQLKKLEHENRDLLEVQSLSRKQLARTQKELDSLTTKAAKLVIAEAQLELNLREVHRLRDEVVELRAQLLAGTEERIKVQALQEVTEASREDLRVLAEQLKAQVEELNRRHVDEILRSREREEALLRERDGEAQARAGLAADVTASREELNRLKLRYDASCLENSESREALHRANTETAELGVHVCMLTAENEEARLRWEGLSMRLQELEDEESQENQQLLNQLNSEEDHLATKQELQKLSKTQREAESLQETNGEEIQALRFQLSSQAISYGSQLQNRRYCQQIEEKNIQMAASENLIHSSAACQEMSENLQRVTQDKQSFDLRTAAELDDLYRTKINLEERLIELIREKDALWQKSDALEFEQKLRDEETEKDVNHCLGCHSQFSWWLRKYNCRLCGRPFCYYCCSNTVSTQQGGSRERCCRDCYNQHSAVVERHPQEEVTHSTPGTPFSRLLQAGRVVTTVSGNKEDGVFDIITEEEVSGVSDSLSFVTACSPVHGQQGAAQLSSSASAGDITSEDTEDLGASVQDSEICLLKSGELTLSVHFTIDDISAFGDSSQELFIKSSCYSTIPITMSSPGPTVTWTFTSEPKSIAFSVVYRESTETPLEQAKVLIPLTRCNSHKETIQGELKVRNPGEYTLIFDNSFSRFISKKVLYHLSLDRPVVYDGSDLL